MQRLRECGREIHLVASPAGIVNVHHELGLDRQGLEALADVAYNPADVGAAIASGSFATAAMVIAPCSMKTLAAVAHGYADNLLARAADVTLKEAAPSVLMVRETPFNLAHLRNMIAVTEMGGIVFPPLPAFYHRPRSIDDLVDDSVERVLACSACRWRNPRPGPGSTRRAALRTAGADPDRGCAAFGFPLRASLQPGAGSHARRAPNTAFGYSGRPRLPL